MDKKEFWITNISNMIVNLHDLNLFIKPYSSINLLDRKHYLISENQIYHSANSGSIFKKKDKIYIRNIAPELKQDIALDIDLEPILPYKQLSTVEFKEEVYEELLLTDEEIADQNSELDDQ